MMEFIRNLDTQKFLEKIKPLAIAGVCFVAVFTAGYGVGKSSGSGGFSAGATKRSLGNYNTNQEASAKANSNTVETPATTTPATAAGTVDKSNCYIKGSKSKLYHVPGGSFYERTNPAACFNSEEEAQAAGYTKSSR